MFKNSEIFEKAPISKAVATLAIPTILGMIVNIVYNMVDTFFVGQTGDPNQVAAVSLATPVFLFLMAAGNIFGIGGSTFLSRALGEGKTDRVKNISSFCFWTGILVGLIGMVSFLLGMQGILKLCGASDHTRKFAQDYLMYIAFGGPFIVVSFGLSNIIRGEGAAKESMFGMMLGTVVNIILDPIMILSLKMGVAGAAIATVIGNICACVYYVLFICSKKSILSINPKYYKIGDGVFSQTFAIGLPASLNNVLMSLSNILMNNFLAFYGDIQVASMGIAMKANMLLVFLMLGVGTGVQPLIAYNYGSKNFKRMKEAIKYAMVCNLIIGSVLTVFYLIFTKQIVGIFIQNDEVIYYGVMMVRALMLSMPILGIMFVFNFTFQAIGKAIPALILSLSRQGLVFIPMLFIGKAIAGLNGIIYAQPIADIISIFLAVIMFLSMNKSFKAEEKITLEK